MGRGGKWDNGRRDGRAGTGAKGIEIFVKRKGLLFSGEGGLEYDYRRK